MDVIVCLNLFSKCNTFSLVTQNWFVYMFLHKNHHATPSAQFMFGKTQNMQRKKSEIIISVECVQQLILT